MEISFFLFQFQRNRYSEFEALNHSPTPAYFSDLCVVIEALGRTARLQFMSWFVRGGKLVFVLFF